MAFIGMRVWVQGKNKPKNFDINTKYIKTVDETNMTITMDDGTQYRIDDESLDIFLAAIYGGGET